MRLSDLFDLDLFDACVAEGLVARRQHPQKALLILNYTDRCQYEPGRWNAVTRQCRGLIVTDTGDVIARPFPKFFNYGQTEAPSFDLSAPVEVTDKLDGSLGILYPVGDGRFAIATRGAFESDQALHATNLLRARYDAFTPPDGWTLLFEIIYPENRIVVDYGPCDDLILLGAVHVDTGRTVGPRHAVLANWPGNMAAVFEYATLADAIAAPPRPNAEGLVIAFESGDRVKVKQEDYLALHRIVTQLNERAVWEHLSASKPIADMLNALPDEFHVWTSEVATSLLGYIEQQEAEIAARHLDIIASLPEGFTRKDFALAAQKTTVAHGLFAAQDGKDFRPHLWRQCYPDSTKGPRVLLDAAPQQEEGRADG